ncbi:substrate-binding domain-containing protein [Streptomyces massasporeus]|uniref:substrate-binding domain-containing protein n=1 Tax=Streptomyces massasporeus TaxID=67324 RepID=UPI003F540891
MRAPWTRWCPARSSRRSSADRTRWPSARRPRCGEAGLWEAGLWEAGLWAPRDVSLVGFDDVPFATGLTPPLTTVRVPYGELGRSVVRLALEREERAAGDDHVVLSTRLVIRQSVRRLE